MCSECSSSTCSSRDVGLKPRICFSVISSILHCGGRHLVFDCAAVIAHCSYGWPRLWPDLAGMAQVVQPETILRWHRAGFKAFWRWKSRNRAGRPKIDRGLRDLIRRMSRENPLWGASRIHGELLMLGFEVAQSTVSKYMARPSRPPSQTWKTFLQNHAEAIAAIDMCVIPTLTFDLSLSQSSSGCEVGFEESRQSYCGMRDLLGISPQTYWLDDRRSAPVAGNA